MSENVLKNSVLARMIIVCCLIFVLLVPAIWVRSLVAERQERKEGAVAEVSKKWGKSQTIAGPLLTIPLERKSRDDSGGALSFIENLHLLPESLIVTGVLSPEVRRRGIYEVILYTMHVHGSGTFDLTPNRDEIPPDANPLWQEACLTIGISDVRGVRESVAVTWGSVPLDAHPSAAEDPSLSGITFRPPVHENVSKYSFDFDFTLNGSSDARFLPLGRRTEVTLSAPWSNPSFIGDFLPAERTVTEKGFRATWRVLELNRNLPQSWIGRRDPTATPSLGVNLLVPVDAYQKTLRTGKYAILIIALTFMALFLSEVLAKELLHPIHYSLVGLALVLFYLLLLSLSEHVGFDLAYGTSALAVLFLVTLYARGIVASKRISSFVGCGLAIVYAFLYVVLQLEDYALLIGSLALLGLLGLVMFLTRHVNWFAMDRRPGTAR